MPVRVRRGCISQKRLVVIKQADLFQIQDNHFRLFMQRNVTLTFMGIYLFHPQETPVIDYNFSGSMMLTKRR